MKDSKINIDNLLKKAEGMAVDHVALMDLDREVLDFFRKVYDKYDDTWVLKTQVLDYFKEYSNVDIKLNKLVAKGLLETSLCGVRRIYRLKVVKKFE